MAVVVDFPDVPPTAIVRLVLEIEANSSERLMIGIFSCFALRALRENPEENHQTLPL